MRTLMTHRQIYVLTVLNLYVHRSPPDYVGFLRFKIEFAGARGQLEHDGEPPEPPF